ncbi:hypothetical protein DNTS_002302 [Danionella cerebrum]|uniref:Somatostatin/Cortistatin C-terminal domain-containing protein n=1 Tax=Danionella cerebrum TaxID=2873325 RepID=A0A553MT04_9TELE|nr:hypothetical protein DNTS_002302 [Danionella translucida]
MFLIISLVLLISLLLPAGAEVENPGNKAMETPAEHQAFLESYIRGRPVVLSGLNDADGPVLFNAPLSDGQSFMKRQQGEEKSTLSDAELFIAKHGKRKEGCKFLYWKSWTAC